MSLTLNEIVDYTTLTKKETKEDIIAICNKAKLLNVKSVCVYPKWVKTAKEELKNSEVLVCTVISFPEGNNSRIEKFNEALQAIENGADEIDMVANYQKVKDNWINEWPEYEVENEVKNEIESLSTLCHYYSKTLKVIVESGLLTIPQVKWFTEICHEADADFIKTSTGKVEVGAELDKVVAMRDVINDRCPGLSIKASGGIRTFEDQKKFFSYVDRFGMGFGSVDKINKLEYENDLNDKKGSSAPMPNLIRGHKYSDEKAAEFLKECVEWLNNLSS